MPAGYRIAEEKSNVAPSKPQNIDNALVPAAVLPPFEAPEGLIRAMAGTGLSIADVNVPRVPFYWKVGWDELCTFRTRHSKTLASPLCLIRTIAQMPEMPTDFPAYVGMMRVEFTTEDGDDLYISHAMCYADTGEYLPLTEWMIQQTVPFVMRFGYIETRNQGKHVIRALPVDIRVEA